MHLHNQANHQPLRRVVVSKSQLDQRQLCATYGKMIQILLFHLLAADNLELRACPFT